MVFDLINIPSDPYEGISMIEIDMIRNRILHHNYFDQTEKESELLLRLAVLILTEVKYINATGSRHCIKRITYQRLQQIIIEIAYSSDLGVDGYNKLINEVKSL